MSLYCTVSEIYSEMLIANRHFEPTPPLFGASVGMTPLKFPEIFDIRKRVPELSYGVVCVIIRLAVLYSAAL